MENKQKVLSIKKTISFPELNKTYNFYVTKNTKMDRISDYIEIFKDIFITNMSLSLLLFPDIKYYIAVKKETQIKDKKFIVPIYALHPISETEFFKQNENKYALNPKLNTDSLGKEQTVFSLEPLQYKKSDEERKEREEMKYIPVKTNVSGGSYGSVDFYDTENVAVKKFLTDDENDFIKEDFVKEVAIYKFLESNCLPNFYNYDINYDIKSRNNKLNITIELGSRTLKDVINNRRSQVIDIRKDIMFNLLTCLRDINNLGIIHCDIKPENIIIDKDNKPKFIDWGLAIIDFTKHQDAYRYYAKYTRGYEAPEVIVSRMFEGNPCKTTYNYKSDIFALGVTFMKLYFGITGIQTFISSDDPLVVYKTLFTNLSGDNRNLTYENIHNSSEYIKGELTRPSQDSIEVDIIELISHMLDVNPLKRWGYQQLLDSNLFKNKIKKSVVSRKYGSKYNIKDIYLHYTNKNQEREKILKFFKYISTERQLIMRDDNGCIIQKCSFSAIFLAIELLDFYMFKKQTQEYRINDYRIEEIIFSILLMTTKIHSNKIQDILSPDDYREIMENIDPRLKVYEVSEIISIETLTNIQKDILDTFDGDILHYTFYDYLSYTTEIFKMENKIYTFFEYIAFIEKNKQIFDCVVNNFYKNKDIYNI